MKFFTDSGIEVPAVTEDQMREVDRIAMEETGPNLYQMMENAGRNLALQAIEVSGPNWENETYNRLGFNNYLSPFGNQYEGPPEVRTKE